MSFVTTALKTVACLIGCMIVADVAGVLVTSLFDISPFSGNSAALPYAIRFVFGIFAGLIAYMSAGAWAAPKQAGRDGMDWIDNPAATSIGTQVAVTGALLLGGLIVWSWQTGLWNDDYYVPDSAPHSITFFASVLLAVIGARVLLKPKA